MKPIVMSSIVLAVVWLLIVTQFASGGSSQAADSWSGARPASTRTLENNKDTVRKHDKEALDAVKLDHE